MAAPSAPRRGKSAGPPRRFGLYALPIAAVVVVALALMTAGSSRPYRVARLWGGPTDGKHLSFRVEVFDVVEDRAGGSQELPVGAGSARVHLRGSGFEAARSVTLDAEGGAEVLFDAPPGGQRYEVAVSQASSDLAAGAVNLPGARWTGAARRRGGWAQGSAGSFDVRVAPARGALAVPFEEQLLVEVGRGGVPLLGANIALSATGARVTPREGTTDAAGRAMFRVQPEEHTVTVAVHVADASGTGDVSFGLGVVPGALRARRDGNQLLVEAPVPRDVAYFALVTEHERLLGGRLPLVVDARGGSTARFELPAGLEPRYAVVSSDRDLRSPSAVGWPLATSPTGAPALTFDAVDALLLDGRPRAALHERLRRDRVRWVTAAFCAAALLIEIALLIGLTRSSDRALDAHLEQAGVGDDDARRLAPKRSPAVVAALVLVALGFLIVALAGLLRLG